MAASALSREDNLATLAQTAIKWSTRVSAPWSEAQAALAHADPQAMAARQEGYGDHELTSTYGGVEPRWGLLSSAPRRVPTQRTIDKPRRTQSAQEVKAFKTFCRTTVAGEAEARQALAAFEQGVQATCLTTSPVRAQSC